MRFIRLEKRPNHTERTESTAIEQKVQLVRDLPVKHTICRSRRGCRGFEVVEAIHGVGGVMKNRGYVMFTNERTM